MARIQIIADETVPFLRGVAEPVADITYLNSQAFTPAAVHDADALIVRSIDKCTRGLLAGSRVRLITTATIGFDHIDTAYCREAGITWKNAPGCNAASVGQYVLASLLTLARLRNESLREKTIGIVGVGHVGRIVEQHCRALGMRVLRNDPPRAEKEGPAGFVPLEALAEEADIITLHVPLTTEGRHATRHLADAAFFGKLARKPWFLNSCRGAVHETEALLAARRSGQIGALVLDCWEGEPAIDRQLLAAADIATPHIAGFSADGKANGTRTCLQNIAQFFGLRFDRLPQVAPPPPVAPLIDLGGMPGIGTAVLHTFDPLPVDRALRDAPERFEWFRSHYAHPREFPAYTVVRPSAEEAALLVRLGFRIQEAR